MTDRKTMAEVDHTHPVTDEPFGTVYRRGPAVADGGARDDDRGESAGGEEGDDADTMVDVDHTPRHGDGANAVWERGENGGDEENGGNAGDGDNAENDGNADADERGRE